MKMIAQLPVAEIFLVKISQQPRIQIKKYILENLHFTKGIKKATSADIADVARSIIGIKGSVMDHLVNVSKNKSYRHHIILYTATMIHDHIRPPGYHVNCQQPTTNNQAF
jgi:hypothetical protein